MFIIAGIGSLIVWYLRKNLPESPRWLEAQGRTDEAETLMQTIEKEVASSVGSVPPAKPASATPQLSAAAMFKPLATPARRKLVSDHDQYAYFWLRNLPAPVLFAAGPDHH